MTRQYKIQNDTFIQLPIWFCSFLLPLSKTSLLFNPYIAIKWQIVYLASVICLISFKYSFKTINIPKFKGMTFLVLCALFFFFILNIFLNESHFFSVVSIDNISFFILFLFFFNIFKSNNNAFTFFSFPIIASTIFFFFINIKNILYYNSFPVIGSHTLSLSFGNINIAAQFVGVSLVFQLDYLLKDRKFTIYKLIISVVCILSFIYIYLAACRSVYLSTFIILILFIFFKYKNLFKLKTFLFFLIGIIVFSAISNKIFFYQDSSLIIKKESSKNHRLSLWKNTIEMIKDNPMGVGTGNFEFGYIPYQVDCQFSPDEKLIEKSPHNEVLRYMSEQGIHIVILFFIFLLSFFLANRDRIKNVFSNNNGFIIIALSVFIFIECVFQFPLLLPFPFFITAIIFGYLFSCLSGDNKLIKFNSKKFNLFDILILFYSLLFLFSFSSKFIETHYFDDYKKSKLGCFISPHNWRICANKIHQEIKLDRLEEAKASLHIELLKRPYNFIAIRLLSGVLNKQGDLINYCHTMWVFDKIFNHKSTVHKKMLKTCNSYIVKQDNSLERSYKKLIDKLALLNG